MKFSEFVGASYEMDAISFDAQRTVNLYPLISESQSSKTPSALRATAGYKLFSVVGGGAIRGVIQTGLGRAFVLSGYEFYEIYTDGTSLLRGTINTGTGIVSMAENKTQVMFVDGVEGWIFNQDTNVFSKITDVDFPICDSVTYQDGYFIVPKKGTANFYLSSLQDGTTWDTLDFAGANTDPDALVSVISDNGSLWLLGKQSVEVFQNTGSSDFPFERISGAIIPVGCAAPHTVRSFDNSIVWLGIDKNGKGNVWKAAGYSNAERISTQAIEAKIASVVDFTESYAYTYQEQGHVFYCLQVKGLDCTLVYDGSTRLWHERTYWDETLGQEKQHLGSCHVFFGQKNLIGDRLSGNIYEQSLSYHDLNGAPRRCIRISPHLNDENKNITYSNFELDMEIGIGNESGSDPQVLLRYSDDGGYTWSNEKSMSAGKIGEYRKRVRWARLGSARSRVFMVSYSEPTFFQINGALINAN